MKNMHVKKTIFSDGFMNIKLEKFSGAKSRHTCPACSSKGAFTRYVYDNGDYLSDDAGRCNRESKCGYHKTPKEHFAENLAFAKFQPKSTTRRNKYLSFATQRRAIKTQNSHFDFIEPEHLKATLHNYDRNAFVEFLFNLFPDCSDAIQNVLKMYFVGTYEDYTCFPSIDRLNHICRAKLIRFNPTTGKRLKGQFDTSSLPAKLKLKENFQYKQIYFGEHLLNKFPSKPVAIVEAEKTAIVASLCLPEFVWLGTGSKTWLKSERLQRLGQRRIILYPDADGFNIWQEISADARKQGLTVDISSLIENHATTKQKVNGFDLADYLINEQYQKNQKEKAYDDFIKSPFFQGWANASLF